MYSEVLIGEKAGIHRSREGHMSLFRCLE